jgi:hypothetical protein
MKKHLVISILAIIALVIVAIGIVTTSNPRPPVHAATTCPDGAQTCLSGWAWSSTIGWLSFNSSDSGAGGGPYDVALSTSSPCSTTAACLSGYAWSSNVGWVKFGGLSSFPTSDTNATAANVTVNLNTGSVTGWARACAGTAPGDCSSMTGRTDGWDGWISLSGTKHQTGDITGNSGVTYNPQTGAFTGFAWGSTNVGWLSFNSSVPVIVTPPPCTGSGCPPAGPSFSVDNTNIQLDSTDNYTITTTVEIYQTGSDTTMQTITPSLSAAPSGYSASIVNPTACTLDATHSSCNETITVKATSPNPPTGSTSFVLMVTGTRSDNVPETGNLGVNVVVSQPNVCQQQSKYSVCLYFDNQASKSLDSQSLSVNKGQAIGTPLDYQSLTDLTGYTCLPEAQLGTGQTSLLGWTDLSSLVPISSVSKAALQSIQTPGTYTLKITCSLPQANNGIESFIAKLFHLDFVQAAGTTISSNNATIQVRSSSEQEI